jgi:hypothetical protein
MFEQIDRWGYFSVLEELLNRMLICKTTFRYKASLVLMLCSVSASGRNGTRRHAKCWPLTFIILPFLHDNPVVGLNKDYLELNIYPTVL